jgi:hypothetical protein
MADEALPAGFIEAGQNYLDSLRRLRFEPDGLFWAWDKTVEEFVLVLVTRHFDYSGPYEIFRLLTLAYNQSATPKEISPFIVRLHSPEQAIIRNLMVLDAHDEDGKRSENITGRGQIADIEYVNHWVYKWPTVMYDQKKKPGRPEGMKRSREFSRFRKEVERLAA